MDENDISAWISKTTSKSNNPYTFLMGTTHIIKDNISEFEIKDKINEDFSVNRYTYEDEDKAIIVHLWSKRQNTWHHFSQEFFSRNLNARISSQKIPCEKCDNNYYHTKEMMRSFEN